MRKQKKPVQIQKEIHFREVAPDLSDVASLLGKMGGEATKAKYGSKHYEKIGKAFLKKHGVDKYREMSLKRWKNKPM